MKITGDEMREALRFNTRFAIGRITPAEAVQRPIRMAKLVARSLCTHARLETTWLTNRRVRIRCEDCGARALHVEKT